MRLNDASTVLDVSISYGLDNIEQYRLAAAGQFGTFATISTDS